MAISLKYMRESLSQAYRTVNENKLNGIRAELAFHKYVSNFGFADRLSPGGWIVRPTEVSSFGGDAVAVFPEEIHPGADIPVGRLVPVVPNAVEAVANFLRPANIQTYFCYPVEDGSTLRWLGILRGGFAPVAPHDICDLIAPHFVRRSGRKPPTYKAKPLKLTGDEVRMEFPLVSLRRYIQRELLCETTDIDRLIKGENTVYPVEIKEKTRAHNKDIGYWFGLDVGPFAKLAYFAAWYGQLKSVFIVHEIHDVKKREHVRWWAIQFSDVAKRASWIFRPGGPAMGGGRSATIRIPLDAFKELDASFVNSL